MAKLTPIRLSHEPSSFLANNHVVIYLSLQKRQAQQHHAIIGGFALHLLGSSRHTNDVDIMIDVVPNKIHDFLRLRLKCISILRSWGSNSIMCPRL